MNVLILCIYFIDLLKVYFIFFLDFDFGFYKRNCCIDIFCYYSDWNKNGRFRVLCFYWRDFIIIG